MESLAIFNIVLIVAIVVLGYFSTRVMKRAIPYIHAKWFIVPELSLVLIPLLSMILWYLNIIGLAISLSVNYICYRKRGAMINEHYRQKEETKNGAEP